MESAMEVEMVEPTVNATAETLELRSQPSEAPHPAVAIADDLRDRAIVIITAGHTPQDVMRSAMQDLKGLGNMAGVMGVMSSGRLSDEQLTLAKRLAVKVIAYTALMQGR